MNEKVFIKMEEYYPPYDKWFENRINPTDDGISIFFNDITERKKTEEKIKDSNDQLLKVGEIAHLGFLERDLKTNEMFLSDEVYKIYGLSKTSEFVAGEVGSNGIHPDDRDFVSKQMRAAIIENKKVAMDHRAVRPNGEMVWVQAYTEPRPDASSKPIKLLGTVMDITERKKAEESLKLAEFKFQTFVDFTYDWEYWEDEHNKFMYMSPSCKQITGYSVEEFISNPKLLHSIIHPDDVDAMIKHYANTHLIKNRHEIDEIKFRIINKDGAIANIHHHCRPIIDSNDKFLGHRISNRDITKRRQAEKQLRLMERAIIQNPVTIVITDINGSIEYVNPKFTEVTGYTAEEAIGGNLRVLQSGEHSQEFYQDLWDTILEGNDWHGEFHNKKKNGEDYWESAVISPVFDDNGNISSFVAVKEDITEKKKMLEDLINAKEKAEESDRLKSAFLANMSHEIRTPMNGILGFTNLLSDIELDDSQRQEYTAIINKSGERLMNTITDLINISKIEAGQMQVLITETSINKMFNELYGFFSSETANKGLTLISLPTRTQTEFIVLTDNTKLYGILVNLIKNAIKYTDKGSISFGYILKNNFIEFYIKDTGIGVPKNRQQAIFNRFEQADIADTRAFQGSGLGLAISKAYVEMLGGKIWMTSKEGEGSEFMFTIPYETMAAQKPEQGLKAKEKLLGETVSKNLDILIVEDKEVNTFFLEIILKDKARNIWYATTGKEAISQCKEHPEINLVLMDIKMPEMDGYEATCEIRKFNKEVLIIAQTAHALPGDHDKVIEAGCNEYISKPIDKIELFSMIQKYF